MERLLGPYTPLYTQVAELYSGDETHDGFVGGKSRVIPTPRTASISLKGRLSPYRAFGQDLSEVALPSVSWSLNRRIVRPNGTPRGVGHPGPNPRSCN